MATSNPRRRVRPQAQAGVELQEFEPLELNEQLKREVAALSRRIQVPRGFESSFEEWKKFVGSNDSFEGVEDREFNERYGQGGAVFDPIRNKMVFRAGLSGKALERAVREEVTHSLHFFLNPTLRQTADSLRDEYHREEALRRDIISYFNRKNPFTEGVVEYLMDPKAADETLREFESLGERQRVLFLKEQKNFGLAYIGTIRRDAMRHGRDIADETVALTIFGMMPGLEKAGVAEGGGPESWGNLALRAQRHGGDAVSSMLDDFNRLTGGRYKATVDAVRQSRALESSHDTLESAAALRTGEDVETTSRAFIGVNMPAGYAKTMQYATVRAFISYKGQFVTDIETEKAAQEGSFYSMVNAIRALEQRSSGVEARGRFEIDQKIGTGGKDEGKQPAKPGEPRVRKAAQPGEVSVKQVAAHIEAMLFGTTIDILSFKHYFIGYDPERDLRRYERQIEGKVRRAMEKETRDADSDLNRRIREELGRHDAELTALAGDPARRAAREAEIRAAATTAMEAEIRGSETQRARERFYGIFEGVIADRLDPLIKAELERRKAELEGIGEEGARKSREKEIEAEVRRSNTGRIREEVYTEWNNKSIEGLIHRDNMVDETVKKDFRKATVADAAALYLRARESGAHFKNNEGRDVTVHSQLPKRINTAAVQCLMGSFDFVNEDGSAMPMEKVREALQKRYGLEFNETIAEDLGWMARDFSHRVHGQYMEITTRYPKRWVWSMNSRQKGVDDPAAVDATEKKLKQAHNAHGDMLTEIESRTDLGTYGRALGIAAHKGFDDIDIQKENVVGRTNPDYKFERVWFLANEFFEDFRDIRGPVLTIENETEYQRLVAEKFWRRLDNQVFVDERGVAHSIKQRDEFVQDFIEEGLPTPQAAIRDYTRRRWGKDDEAGRGTKIRGYEMMIHDVWGSQEIGDGTDLGRNVLAAVNRQGHDFRHVDEISRADVTDEVVAASGMDRETLEKRLAKTKLMHDVRRTTIIYMHTFMVKAEILQQDYKDVRMRTIFRDPTDATPRELLRYEMHQMSRDPDSAFTIDGRPATPEEAADMRRFAFALRDQPDLVGTIFTSTQWMEISGPDTADPKLAAARATNWDDIMRTKVLNVTQRDIIDQLVGNSAVARQRLMHTLLNIEGNFVGINEELLTNAVERSRRMPKPLDDSRSERKFTYQSQIATEALKASSPQYTPENREEEWGRLTLLKFFGVYGERMKALRGVFENPYTPVSVDLIWAPETQAQRDKLLAEMSADLFGPRARFRRLGESLKEASFQEHVRGMNLNVTDSDSLAERARKAAMQDEERKKWAFNETVQRSAVLQFYIFAQDVHAGYRSNGEQYMETNTYGTARDTFKVEAKNLVETMTKIGGDGTIERLWVREFSHAEAGERVVPPRSAEGFMFVLGEAVSPQQVEAGLRRLGLDVGTGVSDIRFDPTDNTRWEAITDRTDPWILRYDPATNRVNVYDGTENVANLRADLQAEPTPGGSISVRSTGYPQTMIMRGISVEGNTWAHEQRAVALLSQDAYARDVMMNLARNQAAYRDYIALERERRVLDRGAVEEVLRRNNVSQEHEAWNTLGRWEAGTANLDDVRRSVGRIRENAMESGMRHMRVTGSREDFNTWFNEYSNGLIQQNNGNNVKAIEYFSRAYSAAKSLGYEAGGADLRVEMLNKRGWARRDLALSMGASKGQMRSAYQLALDDFTGAWLTSRNESPDNVLNPGRWIFRDIRQWWQDRFSNVNKTWMDREDPEALAGLALVTTEINKVSRVAGEHTRRWYLGTSVVSGLATAGLVVTAFATSGLSLAGFAVGTALVSGVSLGTARVGERIETARLWAERAQKAQRIVRDKSGEETLSLNNGRDGLADSRRLELQIVRDLQDQTALTVDIRRQMGEVEERVRRISEEAQRAGREVTDAERRPIDEEHDRLQEQLRVAQERLRRDEAEQVTQRNESLSKGRDLVIQEEGYNREEYVRIHKNRSTSLAVAMAYKNNGDRSWLRFLGTNYATWGVAEGGRANRPKGVIRSGLIDYDRSVEALNPLRTTHILHAFTINDTPGQENPTLMLEQYEDAYTVRSVAKKSLEARGRYYEAAYGMLDRTVDQHTIPQVVREHDRAHRNFNMTSSGWTNVMSLGAAGVAGGAGALVGLATGGVALLGIGAGVAAGAGARALLSWYVGQRWAISDFLTHMDNNEAETRTLEPDFHARTADILTRASQVERNVRLKRGYTDKAKENLQTALGGWEETFATDQPIERSDAQRGLMVNTIHIIHSQGAPVRLR